MLSFTIYNCGHSDSELRALDFQEKQLFFWHFWHTTAVEWTTFRKTYKSYKPMKETSMAFSIWRTLLLNKTILL